MAIQAKVEATVVDLRYYRPRSTDIFLVDTNVWLWYSYDEARKRLDVRRQKNAQTYLSYLPRIRKSGGTIYYCGISLSEMSHSIEIIERDLASAKLPPGTNNKEFRHNFTAERSDFVTEIEKAWRIVKATGKQVTLVVDEPTTDSMLTRHRSYQVDGYDYLLLEAMQKFGITSIITDDVDYITVPGITVFTANFTALDLADRARKLRRRR